MYCNNEWMNSPDILHTDANSGKLKILLINFGCSLSKMEMGL